MFKYEAGFFYLANCPTNTNNYNYIISRCSRIRVFTLFYVLYALSLNRCYLIVYAQHIRQLFIKNTSKMANTTFGCIHYDLLEICFFARQRLFLTAFLPFNIRQQTRKYPN